MNLKDKVIAITGGASGLGEASTRHFVAHGSKVMILDINDDNAKAICDELGDDNVKYINTNIMEEQPVIDAMAFIKESFGRLDVAINCAGTGYGGRILGKEAPHPLDHFKFIIDLNLVGTFNVMRLAAELMDKNDAHQHEIEDLLQKLQNVCDKTFFFVCVFLFLFCFCNHTFPKQYKYFT